jgi:DNA primase
MSNNHNGSIILRSFAALGSVLDPATLPSEPKTPEPNEVYEASSEAAAHAFTQTGLADLLAQLASVSNDLERRGFGHEVLDRQRIGFASGDELVQYLRWRRLPVAAAHRVGLPVRTAVRRWPAALCSRRCVGARLSG